MTSCVHKMCGRTYGQTNMKRAMTLAKINHPWNRYYMPFAHRVYATSHLSFVAFYSYLVNATTNKWLVAYTRCANGRMVKQTWKGLWLSQISTIHEIGIICTWSDHGQSRYRIWIKCDKRQMTSCVHKMCERVYSMVKQTFARVIALFMFVWPYVYPHILCTQLVICLLSHFIHIW
jgi:hypothetical protein